MSKCIISVIIPVYNVENYIERCLASVSNQTFESIEILCIDDCSSDKSFQLIKEYANSDKRIKIYNNDSNLGSGASRNVGIQKAKGKYLSFIDADDFIDNDFLEKLFLSCNQSKADISQARMKRSTSKECFAFDGPIPGLYESRMDKFNQIKNGSCCDKLFRKELFIKNNILFPERILFEDNIVLIRAYHHANKINTNNETFYYYCENSSSNTQSEFNYNKLCSDTIRIAELIINYANANNFSEEEICWIINFIILNIYQHKFCKDENYINDFKKVFENNIKNDQLRILLLKSSRNFYRSIYS